MKKLQLIAALITYCVASIALANDPHQDPSPGNQNSAQSTSASSATGVGIGVGVGVAKNTTKVNSSNTNVNANSNKNDNVNLNSNVAKGGSASAKQSQDQTAIAVSEGSTAKSSSTSGAYAGGSVSGSDVAINTKVEDRLQAPDVSVANVFPTAPCLRGGSLGISVPGGSISGGKSGKTDAGCELRETARSFASIGEEDMAYRLLCASPVVQEYVGTAICLQSRQRKSVPDAVTHAELRTHEDRIIKAVVRK